MPAFIRGPWSWLCCLLNCFELVKETAVIVWMLKWHPWFHVSLTSSLAICSTWMGSWSFSVNMVAVACPLCSQVPFIKICCSTPLPSCDTMCPTQIALRGMMGCGEQRKKRETGLPKEQDAETILVGDTPKMFMRCFENNTRNQQRRKAFHFCQPGDARRDLLSVRAPLLYSGSLAPTDHQVLLCHYLCLQPWPFILRQSCWETYSSTDVGAPWVSSQFTWPHLISQHYPSVYACSL